MTSTTYPLNLLTNSSTTVGPISVPSGATQICAQLQAPSLSDPTTQLEIQFYCSEDGGVTWTGVGDCVATGWTATNKATKQTTNNSINVITCYGDSSNPVGGYQIKATILLSGNSSVSGTAALTVS